MNRSDGVADGVSMREVNARPFFDKLQVQEEGGGSPIVACVVCFIKERLATLTIVFYRDFIVLSETSMHPSICPPYWGGEKVKLVKMKQMLVRFDLQELRLTCHKIWLYWHQECQRYDICCKQREEPPTSSPPKVIRESDIFCWLLSSSWDPFSCAHAVAATSRFFLWLVLSHVLKISKSRMLSQASRLKVCLRSYEIKTTNARIDSPDMQGSFVRLISLNKPAITSCIATYSRFISLRTNDWPSHELCAFESARDANKHVVVCCMTQL